MYSNKSLAIVEFEGSMLRNIKKNTSIFYQKGNYFNRKYFIYIREIKREKPKRLNKYHKHIRD